MRPTSFWLNKLMFIFINRLTVYLSSLSVDLIGAGFVSPLPHRRGLWILIHFLTSSSYFQTLKTKKNMLIFSKILNFIPGESDISELFGSIGFWVINSFRSGYRKWFYLNIYSWKFWGECGDYGIVYKYAKDSRFIHSGRSV